MKNFPDLLLALLSGAISGALVLGITSRIVIAILSIVLGNSLYLSLRGIIEVVFLGALIGAVGGCLLFLLRNIFRDYKIVWGIVTGLLLFFCAMLITIASGRFFFSMSFITK